MKTIPFLLFATVLLFAVGNLPCSASEKPKIEEKPEVILTPEMIEKVKQFHGHSCPGSYLGLRAAEWAAREFGTTKGEKIIVVAEIPFCGVDSLQVVLGCTTGLGNMIVKDYGKHAFNFYRPRDGKKARLLKVETDSPQLNEKLKTLDPNDRKARNQVMQDYILAAPFEELFLVMEPKEAMPDTSRTKRNIACSDCGEGVDSTRIHEVDGKKICPACLYAK